MWTKVIIHLDMDAFYPAVEVLDEQNKEKTRGHANYVFELSVPSF